jgi:hypothetical protein
MKRVLFISGYILVMILVFILGYFVLGSESFRINFNNPNVWNVLSCVIIIIMLLAGFAMLKPYECNYRYEFGKYCKRPATKLHLPSGDYSCDEHSEYFRQRNDKIIDL